MSVLLASILHDHPPAECARLVREAAGLLAPGGTLLLYEWIPNPDTAASDLPLFAVMMMVENDGGDAYSEAEHRAWLEAAGLVRDRAAARLRPDRRHRRARGDDTELNSRPRETRRARRLRPGRRARHAAAGAANS